MKFTGNRMSVSEAATMVLMVIGMLILFSLLLSFPLMLLWNNCLVPAVTTLKEVGWLQMWGISILIGLLFKPSTASTKS